MDFCTDGTLEMWIKDGRITDLVAIEFLADLILIAGVAYLHVEKQVVHRDIKPANIFITRDPAKHSGRPVLVVGDLGLAKKVMGSKAKVTTGGTLLYMAPETQQGGSKSTQRHDPMSSLTSSFAVELTIQILQVETHRRHQSASPRF